jgi:hypothetical protein
MHLLREADYCSTSCLPQAYTKADGTQVKVCMYKVFSRWSLQLQNKQAFIDVVA